MRAFDSPYIADWFAISLRWLTLIGLTISLATGSEIQSGYWLLVILVLWNVFLSALAGLNRRLLRHREISVAIDLFVSGAFFWLQGGYSGPAAWVVILPVIPSAIYFEWRGLIVAAVMTVAQFGLAWLAVPTVNALVFASAGAVIILGLSGLFGFLSRRLINSIRTMRSEQTEARARAARLENERLRAIYTLTSSLTATLNYQRVLEYALDLGMDALNSGSESQPDGLLASAVLLFSEGKLIVGAARRFTPSDMRISLPAQSGLLAQVTADGEPVITDEVSLDPELGRIIALRACQSAYFFPLRSGYNIYGVLLYAHPTQDFFSPDRIEVLDIIGHQAVIAIQNARLYQDLVEEKERIVAVQEDERKKLARDLHDGPTQSVAALAMRANIARRMLERDPKAALQELVGIEDLARRTTKEIRHMLFTLRPLVLESQGLVVALETMAEKMKETYDQTVQVTVEQALVDHLEMNKQGVIFYIVEEAVNNARKHARAKNIWIRLRVVQKEIYLLEVQDDGAGFDLQEVNRSYDKRGSLGMVNLRERTELVGGLLNIQAAPGKGTRVQVYIPLTDEAADRLHHAKNK